MDQPAGPPGARRGRDAGAGEGAGERFPSADAFIAALDAALREPASAPDRILRALPPSSRSPLEKEPEKKKNANGAAGSGSRSASPHRRRPDRLALHQTRAAEDSQRDRQALEFAILQARTPGLTRSAKKSSLNSRAAPYDPDQDPLPDPPKKTSPPNLFCSKPKVDTLHQHRPADGTVPGPEQTVEQRPKPSKSRFGSGSTGAAPARSKKDSSSAPSRRRRSATRDPKCTLFVSGGPSRSSCRSSPSSQTLGRGPAGSAPRPGAVGLRKESNAPRGSAAADRRTPAPRSSEGSTVSIVVARASRRSGFRT